MENREPNWQPITMLPTFSEMIDGMLDSSEEQLVNFRQAPEKPHVLDDGTVERVLKLYTEQLEFCPLYLQQFEKWKEYGVSPLDKEEIDRLTEQTYKLVLVDQEILAIANSIKDKTIDKIMDMDDAELAVKVLSGELKSPTNIDKSSNNIKVSKKHDKIASRIDKKVKQLLSRNCSDMDLLGEMADSMPDFKKLMDAGSIDTLAKKYDGLYHYACILGNLAEGIHNGEIEVPA